MIITRSPLRITLGGGGTDLPSYYRKHGGFLISAAIDKYVYITLHYPFEQVINIKYSKMEKVKTIEEIQHPIFRETLNLIYNTSTPNIELSSFADIPAGTGLGSSGSFTTALLKALHTYERDLIHPQELAERACYIEIDRLGEPIGKQDQYISAYGGITCFRFLEDGQVEAWPLNISPETLYTLEDNILLFFTGYSREASSILKEQDDKSEKHDREMIQNLHYVKDMGKRSQNALESGELHEFANIMKEHWEYKKQRSSSMSTPKIDEWYNLAIENGALGGKLIGAGGGGFLMFYSEDKVRLRSTMKKVGLEEIRFRFDYEGTKVVIQ